MKRTAIRRVSKKRAKENALYTKVKNAYMQDHPVCEACQNYMSQSLHHKARRGKYLCDTRYFLACCNLCHSKIEMFPKWAREMGYLLDKFNPGK